MALTPNVVDEAVIETVWGNAIRDRTLQRFVSNAERDTWAANDGSIAYTSDLARVWLRTAGTWKLIAGSMPRVRLQATTPQSTAHGTPASLIWQTEVSDTDNLHAANAATIVVPAGLGGRWRFEFSISWAAQTGGMRQAWMLVGGRRMASTGITPTANAQSGSAESVLNVGDTAQVQVFQDSGVAVNVNVLAAEDYFQAQYVGPS